MFITCATKAEKACFEVSYLCLTKIKIVQLRAGLSVILLIASEQKQTTAKASWMIPPKTPNKLHSLSIIILVCKI